MQETPALASMMSLTRAHTQLSPAGPAVMLMYPRGVRNQESVPLNPGRGVEGRNRAASTAASACALQLLPCARNRNADPRVAAVSAAVYT